MGGVISKITAGGATHVVTSALYGTCTTAAATAAKEVILSNTNITATDWLETGVVLFVKFTYANGVASPTLTIKSGASGNAQLIAAKSIMRYGTTAPSTNANTSWNAGSVVTFVYDGTYWQIADYALRGNDNTVPSAYSTTAAGTAAKTATFTNYNLLANSYFMLVISTTNSVADAITLNVNGKGAKPIYINGVVSSASNHTMPAGTYLVYYNGTNYYVRTDGKITGSITGNAATVGGYTPGNACTKTVDTSISSTSSTNLPTTAAVTAYTNDIIVIDENEPTSALTKIWIKI